MKIEVLIALFVVHWLADFVFQRRVDAENKHDNIYALLSHFFWYMLITNTAVSFIIPIFIDDTGWNNVAYVVCISWLHFVTDYFTSKLSYYYGSSGKPKKFWITIGADQLLHQIQILIMYSIFLKG